jgi:hypothetical protein
MCVLHLEIDTNNIDLILEGTNLPIYQVYRKGKKHKHRKDFIFDTNLISCEVSNKEWDDFEGQTNDMIEFLNKYHIDLQSIKDNFNDFNWQFDLPYTCRLDESTFNQNDFLSPELLYQSGRLGIGINLSMCNQGEDDEL